MKIRIIAVGKVKDQYLINGVNEYIKKINPYCSLTIDEVKDETFKKESSYEIEKAKKIEGERILAKLKNTDYVITLDLNKNHITSEEFSELIKTKLDQNGASITFIIGGSYGLSEEVKKRSNYGLSLSKMTFLHSMTRLILLEQLYRAFKILSNETYHK